MIVSTGDMSLTNPTQIRYKEDQAWVQVDSNGMWRKVIYQSSDNFRNIR